ncbi:hypothetical protein BpHYR1_017897 [Brachionus plicatilis]|uniref:Uncharacterized protein n=1 Tax=Brachionus plicatilis TaxID=10195 RepID=A0A3M7SXI6_BRAPC|nr:hypothetical protein BpHYR1_017897 [Brachionus plicatilis]
MLNWVKCNPMSLLLVFSLITIEDLEVDSAGRFVLVNVPSSEHFWLSFVLVLAFSALDLAIASFRAFILFKLMSSSSSVGLRIIKSFSE